MKAFALLTLLSLNVYASSNSNVECTRSMNDETTMTYSFHFDAPRVVSVSIAHEDSVITPPSRSVLFSQGRLVGMQNELAGEEELFLLPHAVFDPSRLNEWMKVEVMLRGNYHFYVQCRGL